MIRFRRSQLICGYDHQAKIAVGTAAAFEAALEISATGPLAPMRDPHEGLVVRSGRTGGLRGALVRVHAREIVRVHEEIGKAVDAGRLRAGIAQDRYFARHPACHLRPVLCQLRPSPGGSPRSILQRRAGQGKRVTTGEVADIDAALQMHLAGEDEFMPTEAQRSIIAALASSSRCEAFSYPACRHASSRHGGMHFDAGAARHSRARALEFFDRNLAQDMGLIQ
jgi:hypothetical protein